MWWRLGILWAAAAVIVYAMFLQVEVHTVTLAMPSGMSVQQAERAMNAGFTAFGDLLLLIALALLGVFVWLNIRIILRYRKSR